VQFDVTSSVQAHYSGTNNGFLIRDSVEGATAPQEFYSRESLAAQRPKLAVTFG
jgi:hypothetical protein